MYKWCARHGRLIMYLWSLPIPLALLVFFILLDMSLILWLLYFVFMIFTSWVFVNSCARNVINRAIKQLNDNCDPYPLLEETTEQLSYSRSKTYKLELLINKCAALSALGEYDKVVKELENINIDKYSSTLPIAKITYYNNLGGVYIDTGDICKAEIWLDKSMKMAADFKNKKIQKKLLKTGQLNNAAIKYFNNEYEEAEKILQFLEIPDNCRRELVGISLLLAKIYLKTDRIQEAKSKLLYVVDNGNKLIDCEEAKNLLSQLN